MGKKRIADGDRSIVFKWLEYENSAPAQLAETYIKLIEDQLQLAIEQRNELARIFIPEHSLAVALDDGDIDALNEYGPDKARASIEELVKKTFRGN